MVQENEGHPRSHKQQLAASGAHQRSNSAEATTATKQDEEGIYKLHSKGIYSRGRHVHVSGLLKRLRIRS